MTSVRGHFALVIFRSGESPPLIHLRNQPIQRSVTKVAFYPLRAIAGQGQETLQRATQPKGTLRGLRKPVPASLTRGCPRRPPCGRPERSEGLVAMSSFAALRTAQQSAASTSFAVLTLLGMTKSMLRLNKFTRSAWQQRRIGPENPQGSPTIKLRQPVHCGPSVPSSGDPREPTAPRNVEPK